MINLIRLADSLDGKGFYNEANMIDKILEVQSYEKYLDHVPEDGGQYYVLHIPKDATPPKEGQKLTLRGNPVVVQSDSTPDDIAKGRGGPVARSLEANGIGWSVNCLPEGHEWLKR